MQYKQFKDIKLSRLAMGNMRLPILNDDAGAIDDIKGQEMIDYCMANGINYYDTAYIYHGGNSERFLGQALSKYPRDSYYLADKLKLSANSNYHQQFKEQLERLGVDYLDFYLMHGIWDSNIDAYLNQEMLDYFNHLRKIGKIKYLGFSFHGTPATLKRYLEANDWDFVQIQLNYYDWYYGSARQQYEMITEKKIPIMVMEPVHGGLLADLNDEAANILMKIDNSKSMASWA